MTTAWKKHFLLSNLCFPHCYCNKSIHMSCMSSWFTSIFKPKKRRRRKANTFLIMFLSASYACVLSTIFWLDPPLTFYSKFSDCLSVHILCQKSLSKNFFSLNFNGCQCHCKTFKSNCYYYSWYGKGKIKCLGNNKNEKQKQENFRFSPALSLNGFLKLVWLLH